MKRAKESKKWYFHPTIFIKILWGIFSFVLLGIFIYFSVLTLDPFFRVVVGSTNGAILCFGAALTLITIVTGIVGNFNVFDKRNYIFICHIAVSIVIAIVSIVFIAAYGTVSVRENAFNKIHDFVIEHRYEDGNPQIDWFKKHVHSLKNTTDNDHALRDSEYSYADDRTEDAGSCTIGGLSAWVLFSCLMIYIWVTDQRAPDPAPLQVSLTSNDGMSQYNEKILNSNLIHNF